jgi:hypothetical protein
MRRSATQSLHVRGSRVRRACLFIVRLPLQPPCLCATRCTPRLVRPPRERCSAYARLRHRHASARQSLQNVTHTLEALVGWLAGWHGLSYVTPTPPLASVAAFLSRHSLAACHTIAPRHRATHATRPLRTLIIYVRRHVSLTLPSSQMDSADPHRMREDMVSPFIDELVQRVRNMCGDGPDCIQVVPKATEKASTACITAMQMDGGIRAVVMRMSHLKQHKKPIVAGDTLVHEGKHCLRSTDKASDLSFVFRSLQYSVIAGMDLLETEGSMKKSEEFQIFGATMFPGGNREDGAVFNGIKVRRPRTPFRPFALTPRVYVQVPVVDMTYRDPSPAYWEWADTWIRQVNAVGVVYGYAHRFGDMQAPTELEQLADLVFALQAKLVDDKWKSKHATLVAKAEAKALEKALLHVDDTVRDPASAKSVLLSLEILHTDWANHALDAESAKITTAENDLMQWARVSLDSVNQRKAETARQVLKSDWAQSHLNEADIAKIAELEVSVFSRLLSRPGSCRSAGLTHADPLGSVSALLHAHPVSR